MRKILHVVLSCLLSALLFSNPLCVIAEELTSIPEDVESLQVVEAEEEGSLEIPPVDESSPQEQPETRDVIPVDEAVEAQPETQEVPLADDVIDEEIPTDVVVETIPDVEKDSTEEAPVEPEASDSLEAMAEANGKASVQYFAHIQNIGW